MKILYLILATIAMAVGTWGSVARADIAHDIDNAARPAETGSILRGDVFARSLYETFTANGVEAYCINFQWGYRHPDGHWACFVVFKDSEGRYWGRGEHLGPLQVAAGKRSPAVDEPLL